MVKRSSHVRPGWDCVRHPCGKRGCGTEPGRGHGIHCDDWVYSVSDGDLAIVLTVFSGRFPASVPNPPTAGFPSGADLTLHVGFPVRGGGPGRDCEHVGKCYQGGRFTTATGADDFFAVHFRPEAGFDQPEHFWRALEQELAHWKPDAEDARMPVFAHGQRVRCEEPGSWVNGRVGEVLEVDVLGPDDVRGLLLKVDAGGTTVVEPDRCFLVGRSA